MTAKQAIKARCRDCSGRECGFEEYALKGLAGKEGRCDRTETIRQDRDDQEVLPVVYERPPG
jgi:hypothetical protein